MSAQTTIGEWASQPEPRDEPETLFEQVTGLRETIERQQPDGDRVVGEERIDLEDGLEDTISHDSEVFPRR